MTTPNDEPDHGAECVKAYDEYAARHGYSPTCPPGDLTPYRDWIKRADDPEIRPGDVAVFGFDYPHDPSYGHVKIITKQQARHYRRQTRRQQVRSFLARLADSVRGRK